MKLLYEIEVIFREKKIEIFYICSSLTLLRIKKKLPKNNLNSKVKNRPWCLPRNDKDTVV